MDETFKALKPSPLRKGHSRGRAGRRWGLTRLVPPRGGTCPLHSAGAPQTHCPCRGEERPGGGGGPEARRERPRRRRPHRLRLRLRSRGTASSRSPAGSGGARRPRPAGASPSARGVPGGGAAAWGRRAWPLAAGHPWAAQPPHTPFCGYWKSGNKNATDCVHSDATVLCTKEAVLALTCKRGDAQPQLSSQAAPCARGLGTRCVPPPPRGRPASRTPVPEVPSRCASGGARSSGVPSPCTVPRTATATHSRGSRGGEATRPSRCAAHRARNEPRSPPEEPRLPQPPPAGRGAEELGVPAAPRPPSPRPGDPASTLNCGSTEEPPHGGRACPRRPLLQEGAGPRPAHMGEPAAGKQGALGDRRARGGRGRRAAPARLSRGAELPTQALRMRRPAPTRGRVGHQVRCTWLLQGLRGPSPACRDA